MAATAWVRSLSCKSSAVADDVYSQPLLLPKKHPPPPAKPSAASSLPSSRERRSACSTTDQDRPATKTKKKRDTSKHAKKTPPQPPARLAPSPARRSSAFLAMTELPEGHSSRRVVELIFASGWAAHEPEAEVEAMFRVRSMARAVARFEDARAAARARGADAADARCAADGNEMMRFQCRAAEAGVDSVICAAVATTGGPSSSAVRTFASSGAADAGAGGGATPGRRGMLVCRVIAGRVRRAADPSCHGGEYDSVDAGGGELVVLDSRAVLPCFLIIYKVKAPDSPCSSSCPSR